MTSDLGTSPDGDAIVKAPLWRWGLFFALFFALGVGVTQTFPVRAGDVFWNIRVGLVLLDQGELPRHDMLTHTAGQRPWIHHEWGAQVLWATIYRAAGWPGVRALRGVLVALLLGAWLLVARRLLSSWGWATAVVAWGWLTLEPHISARPRLFGWVLLGWACYFFFSHAAPWTWRRFTAFAIYATVWVNIHSSALLLPLLASLELAGWATALAWRRSLRARRAELAPHALRFVLGALALLLQPAGVSLLGYIWKTPRLNRVYSTEWWPLWRPDVWHEHPIIVVAVALLAIASATLMLRRLVTKQALPASGQTSDTAAAGSFPTALTALTLVGLAIYSRRMTALLVIAALFVCQEARAWPPLVRFSTQLRAGLGVAMQGALVLTLVALSARALPGGALLAPPQIDQSLPVGATSFLERTKLKGKLYNPDGWGGYLAFRLYPKQRVFLDGRWILVGERVFLDSLAVILRRDAEQILDRYGIELIVQPAQFYYRTPALPRSTWLLAYQDHVAVVLVRRRSPLATANLQRICAFYRRHALLAPRGHWPRQLRSGDNSATPTDIPTATALCEPRSSIE